MTFESIIIKISQIQEDSVGAMKLKKYRSKDPKDVVALDKSVDAIERIHVDKKVTGYKVKYLQTALFILEGHISRHFDKDTKIKRLLGEINTLQHKLLEVLNATK